MPADAMDWGGDQMRFIYIRGNEVYSSDINARSLTGLVFSLMCVLILIYRYYHLLILTHIDLL